MPPPPPIPFDENKTQSRNGHDGDARKVSVAQNNTLTPLPQIYGSDARIDNPQSHFRFTRRYQYLRLLGHGAYGMVCAALDQETGSTVAIKRVSKISSLLVAKRTLRELKLLRHFQGHPNIISIRDLFLQMPTARSFFLGTSSFEDLYISLDLMDADLCHIIQSKYPLSESHCQRFLYQLLCGVKAMHSANVIHRDLKPGNILWKHNGELCICDFGLARGIDENEFSAVGGSLNNEMALTNYVATRWYRPPEILMTSAKYGKPLDIWSVGCIFAELLGRKVFLPGGNAVEQLHLIFQKLGTPDDEYISRIPSERCRLYIQRLPKYKVIPLSERFPHASPEALDLLGKMLQFEPQKRITVNEALSHPYFVRFRNEQKEISLPSFDFSFDSQCTTLAETKNLILQEIRYYQVPQPEQPVVGMMNRLYIEESQRQQTHVRQRSQPGSSEQRPKISGSTIMPMLPSWSGLTGLYDSHLGKQQRKN